MKARLVEFGVLEIEGRRYEHDVILDAGRVRKRRKGPSKALRGRYGHTPLTAAEDIPWGGRRLIVGTGVDGLLPIAPDVESEARRRNVQVVAVPTEEACALLRDLRPRDVCAILHATC
jgi:hypothetical protein